MKSNNATSLKPTEPGGERRTLTIPEAGEMLGISRNGAYEAARRGDIPTIRIGRLLKVPKVALDRLLERAGDKRAVEAA